MGTARSSRDITRGGTTEDGPLRAGGWAIENRKVGHWEPVDGPLETSGWAIGNRRTGHWEPEDGGQHGTRNLEYGPRGKDTTKELQGPQRRDQDSEEP